VIKGMAGTFQHKRMHRKLAPPPFEFVSRSACPKVNRKFEPLSKERRITDVILQLSHRDQII